MSRICVIQAALLAVLCGCSDDTSGIGGMEPDDERDSGAAHHQDAGPPANPDTGAPAAMEDAGADASAAPDAAMDASEADAGPECDDGEIPCSGDCLQAIDPTVGDVQDRVFRIGCALSDSCHTGTTPKEGLDLSSPAVVLAAVGVDAAQKSGMKLIKAGEPGNSYLVHKLRNTDIAAKSSEGLATSRMPPPPTPALCEAKIQAVEQWIADGAKDN